MIDRLAHGGESIIIAVRASNKIIHVFARREMIADENWKRRKKSRLRSNFDAVGAAQQSRRRLLNDLLEGAALLLEQQPATDASKPRKKRKAEDDDRRRGGDQRQRRPSCQKAEHCGGLK